MVLTEVRRFPVKLDSRFTIRQERFHPHQKTSIDSLSNQFLDYCFSIACIMSYAADIQKCCCTYLFCSDWFRQLVNEGQKLVHRASSIVFCFVLCMKASAERCSKQSKKCSEVKWKWKWEWFNVVFDSPLITKVSQYSLKAGHMRHCKNKKRNTSLK